MNKGFSLVELIVVIAIMAILVGVAVPVYSGYITKANNNVDAQLVDEIDRAIDVMLIDPEYTFKATDDSAAVTITLAANGTLTSTNLDNGESLIASLQDIIKPSALKGENYASGVVFTLDLKKKTCSYLAVK